MNKILIWIGSVVVAGALLLLASNAIFKNVPPRTVDVTGVCSVSVPRDRASITLRIRTLADLSSESVAAASEIIADVNEYLADNDIESRTASFSSREKTRWDAELQKSVTSGIETSVAIEVTANSVAPIESLLAQFAGIDSVYFDGLRMFVDENALQDAQRRCLAVAVADARDRAVAMASGDGVRVGKMIYVSDSLGDDACAMPIAAPVFANAAALDLSGAITSSDANVSVTVYATFELTQR